MLSCVAMGSLHEPVSSGSLFPLWASSSLKGTVKRQAGPTNGWAPSTSEDVPFSKAECLLGLHLLAFRKPVLPEAQWAELEVTSLGHSCGLCEPWEHAQAERATPRTSGSLASHLCLSILSSSACFVDTWPRLSRHLFLFLLGQQPFPRYRADSRAAPPTCNRPPALMLTGIAGDFGVPTLTQTEIGGTAVHSSWQLSFPGPAPCLSFLVCQMGMITGPPPQGEARWCMGNSGTGSGTRMSCFPLVSTSPGPFGASRPIHRQKGNPGQRVLHHVPPSAGLPRALGREGVEPSSRFASGFPPEAVTERERGAGIHFLPLRNVSH